MNRLSKLIFLCIIILSFSFALYFEHKQINISKLNPAPIEKPKVRNKSLFEIYQFHKNRKKTSNTERFPADINQEECSMVRKVTENVKTNFAGYVLEYPCTSGSHGSIRIEKSESGNIINHEHTLYLGIQLSDENKSIWSDRLSNSREGKESFLIILKSNGNTKSSPLFDNLHQYTHVKTDDLAELSTYYKTSNPRRVIGILKNSKDASGYPPSVSCYLDAVDEIDDVFSDLYNMSYKYASCSAHWMLTKDISLVVHSFDARYAYKFKDLYKMINPGIEEIIIQKPS